jgi:DNA-binding MarR family transcriptional regulator
LISLTGAGRDVIAEYDSRVAALERQMLAPLSADEAVQLRRLFARCRTGLA